mmetsp:Transcript_13055/g.38373  ORF Transcript_13055/g.38373 Transcript_13055/m.38373 type:complete len:266 (+) Transcript_13055:1201-1998(+)
MQDMSPISAPRTLSSSAPMRSTHPSPSSSLCRTSPLDILLVPSLLCRRGSFSLRITNEVGTPRPRSRMSLIRSNCHRSSRLSWDVRASYPVLSASVWRRAERRATNASRADGSRGFPETNSCLWTLTMPNLKLSLLPFAVGVRSLNVRSSAAHLAASLSLSLSQLLSPSAATTRLIIIDTFLAALSISAPMLDDDHPASRSTSPYDRAPVSSSERKRGRPDRRWRNTDPRAHRSWVGSGCSCSTGNRKEDEDEMEARRVAAASGG